MEDNIPKKCRVCLRHKDVYLKDITHHNNEDETINFQIAFEVITSIYINDFENDRFLCGDCLKRLTQAYEFRCDALRSGQKLQQIGTVMMRELNIKTENESCSEAGDYEENYFIDPDPWMKIESTLDIKDEPVVFDNDKTKTTENKSAKGRPKKKTQKPMEDLLYLNKAYCRFCLKHFSSKLGQHEREHIGNFNSVVS